VVRRFKDVAKLPLGMTMAALPAYLAYKEYQKTGAATIRDGSPFISHGGIPEMAQPGGEEIKTEQGAGDPAMGNGLDGRGRFADGAKEGTVRANLIKHARNWTAAQRKHYFKTLKESGKYKTKKQYEEDKKKNYKAKEVQRPGTSERPAKPRQKVGG
jgi:hypothetical protein